MTPGKTSIHYVSVLDENGDTIMTAPMERPIEIPGSQALVGFDYKINVDLQLKLAASGSR